MKHSATIQSFNFDVQAEILTAYDGIKSYDPFVRRLKSICEPDAKAFETFESTLIKAYALWACLEKADSKLESLS